MPAEDLTEGHPPRLGTRRQVALALAIFFAAVALLLGESLFGPKVLTQADALYQFEPWASVAPEDYRPSNHLLLDQSIVFLPWMHFAAEQLARGELPLWNPDNYCGQPLVGSVQSAIYWPLNWIYYLWPSWSVHAWTAAIRLVAAGLFTYLLLRRLGLGFGSSVVGGLGFMLSGFMVAWLNHVQTNVALFLPALFWSVERMAARPGRREASLFGLLVGLQLLAGHLQTSLHLTLFVGAYVLFRLWRPIGSLRLSRRGFGWLCGGALAGALLSAPQLLPVLEYLETSQGGKVLEQIDPVGREGVKAASVLMVAPDRYGGPHTHDYTGPLGPNVNYNELIGGYVGRLLLVLALLQVLWLSRASPLGRGTLYFAAATLVAALVAYQVFPVYELFRAVPRLRSTKLMRLFLVVAFGLSVLGAAGLEGLFARFRLKAGACALACAAAIAVVAAELLSFAHGYNPQVDAEVLLPRTQVTDFLQRETEPYRALGIDTTTLMPSANLFYGVPMVSGYDAVEYAALTELVLQLTNNPPVYPFISGIRAFDRIEALPIASLLNVKYLLSPIALPPPLEPVLDAELLVYRNPDARPRAFLARDAVVLEDSAERLAYMGRPDFDPEVAVLEHDSPGLVRFRDAWSEEGDLGDLTLVSHEPREVLIEVDVPRPSLVVLADVWDREWSAELVPLDTDEAPTAVPIERVDHALRGVWVEPGRWSLRMRYDPRSTRIGLSLAAVALLALGFWARPLGRPRARSTQAS